MSVVYEKFVDRIIYERCIIYSVIVIYLCNIVGYCHGTIERILVLFPPIDNVVLIYLRIQSRYRKIETQQYLTNPLFEEDSILVTVVSVNNNTS